MWVTIWEYHCRRPEPHGISSLVFSLTLMFHLLHEMWAVKALDFLLLLLCFTENLDYLWQVRNAIYLLFVTKEIPHSLDPCLSHQFLKETKCLDLLSLLGLLKVIFIPGIDSNDPRNIASTFVFLWHSKGYKAMLSLSFEMGNVV